MLLSMRNSPGHTLTNYHSQPLYVGPLVAGARLATRRPTWFSIEFGLDSRRLILSYPKAFKLFDVKILA